MIGASGVRGIVGEDLDPELVAKFAAAFGEFLAGGLVVVASDTRPSNEMFRYAIFAGLLSSGCEVVDLGICPTPSLQLMVTGLEA
ncbi:phosphoglucosamine mutase, partial [Candidatus Aerophobetes bacterium]